MRWRNHFTFNIAPQEYWQINYAVDRYITSCSHTSDMRKLNNYFKIHIPQEKGKWQRTSTFVFFIMQVRETETIRTSDHPISRSYALQRHVPQRTGEFWLQTTVRFRSFSTSRNHQMPDAQTSTPDFLCGSLSRLGVCSKNPYNSYPLCQNVCHKIHAVHCLLKLEKNLTFQKLSSSVLKNRLALVCGII